MDHCMDHDTNQSVEEDGTDVFEPSRVSHLLAVSEFFYRCCIVVHGNEDGSQWLGRLSNNSCPSLVHIITKGNN